MRTDTSMSDFNKINFCYGSENKNSIDFTLNQNLYWQYNIILEL